MHIVITNQILKNALRFSGKVGVMASEEEDVPMAVDTANKYRDIGLRTTQFKSDVSHLYKLIVII